MCQIPAFPDGQELIGVIGQGQTLRLWGFGFSGSLRVQKLCGDFSSSALARTEQWETLSPPTPGGFTLLWETPEKPHLSVVPGWDSLIDLTKLFPSVTHPPSDSHTPWSQRRAAAARGKPLTVGFGRKRLVMPICALGVLQLAQIIRQRHQEE